MTKNLLKSCVKSLMMLSVLGLATGYALGAVETEQSVKIKEAMTVMKASAAKLGEPSVSADTLLFGTTKMNGNVEFVDALKTQFGCTATLFMKKGDGFIRVSTDIMKDGNRAIGTQLDPSGPVIAAIQKGEAFYGVVDILGSSYDTGYEPMKNAAGEIIGIYYVGYPVNK